MTKYCEDCVHFRPWEGPAEYAAHYAECARPRRNVKPYLISRKGEPQSERTGMYCATERGLSGIDAWFLEACGVKGRYFKSRNVLANAQPLIGGRTA